MKTVRQRILDYIRLQRAVTAAEISQAFQMTQANARHHLTSLEESGLIHVIDLRPAPGRGRPSQVFSLSEGKSGDNLGLLASLLLNQFRPSSDPGCQDQFLQGLADQLASQILREQGDAGRPARAGENLTRRLYWATQALNQRHYQARWEARPDAPRLILAHCPYAAILEEHPELCRFDAYLIERLSGSLVEQTARLVKDPLGFKYCVFRFFKDRV